MTLGTHTYNDMCTYHKPLPIFGADEIEIFRNGNNPTWYIDQCTMYYKFSLPIWEGVGLRKKATKKNTHTHRGIYIYYIYIYQWYIKGCGFY